MFKKKGSQQTFTCSKPKIKTYKKVWNIIKVDNKDTRTTSLTSFWCLFVNFEHISHLFLVFLLFTLSRYLFAGLKNSNIIPTTIIIVIIFIIPEAYIGPSKKSMMKLFSKVVNGLKLLTIFAKTLHHRCLTASEVLPSI